LSAGRPALSARARIAGNGHMPRFCRQLVSGLPAQAPTCDEEVDESRHSTVTRRLFLLWPGSARHLAESRVAARGFLEVADGLRRSFSDFIVEIDSSPSLCVPCIPSRDIDRNPCPL
jgi:hypothetical protein